MGMNSIRKRVSDWTVPVRKRGPVSIQGSPYRNGYPFHLLPHMETGIHPFHMGMFLSPFTYGDHHMETGNRLFSSLYGNRDHHLEIPNPRFHMAITIWKWGTVSFSSLYGNGDHHMEMVISKGCVNPCFHMVITIWKRGTVSFSSLYGNGDSHMETGIPVSIW